jgi:hypothetical protein
MNDFRRWEERGFGDKTFEVVNKLVYPGDTEQRRESGDTEENPHCK